jgi:hypothetical protein
MTSQDNPQLFPSETRRLSNYEVGEKAADAKALLDDKTFKNAMSDVYSRATGTLLSAEVGSLTASAAHATMKAILDIKKQLEEYVNDDKMRQKFTKGDK